MKLIVVNHYDAMSDLAFQLILDTIHKQPHPVIGLATGSTPLGIYQRWINYAKDHQASFSHLTTINLDEYVGIDSHHSQSYATFMNHHLFSRLSSPPENRYIPRGDATFMEEECRQYDDIIRSHPIDIQILGIGSNGHIGFNEPGTPFESMTHIVQLDNQTRIDNARFFNSFEEVPQQAITMGISSILLAKKILLLAHGIGKSKAIVDLFTSSPRESLPASALITHPDVIVICDKLAYSKLEAHHKNNAESIQIIDSTQEILSLKEVLK